MMISGAIPAGLNPVAASHTYQAYGMTIHSDLALPELRDGAGPPDLVFRRAPPTRPALGPCEAVYEFGDTHAYIAIGEVGQFAITSPAHVDFTPAPDAEPAHVNLVLLGSVLATILLLRGYLTLHASALEVGGAGIAFLGDKGAGKSTTAAAFIRAGHKLLGDDLAPVRFSQDGPWFLPGFGQLKLSDNAAAAIPLRGATTSPIARLDYVKSRLKLQKGFAAAPAPVRRLYILARGETLAIEHLPKDAALAAVMRNAYHARFGAQVFRGVAAADLLRRCGMLLSHVPVRQLTVPASFDRLPDLVRLVEQDIN